MKWKTRYSEPAKKDLKKLDNSVKLQVFKAVDRVSINPVSIFEGGYGMPLGNKGGRNLTGLLKIKLKHAGVRVIYKVEKRDREMVIIVIGIRADEEAYDIAERRMKLYE